MTKNVKAWVWKRYGPMIAIANYCLVELLLLKMTPVWAYLIINILYNFGQWCILIENDSIYAFRNGLTIVFLDQNLSSKVSTCPVVKHDIAP